MNNELMEILVCPHCKGTLVYDPAASQLICKVDRVTYPIINDIPIMIRGRKMDNDDSQSDVEEAKHSFDS